MHSQYQCNVLVKDISASACDKKYKKYGKTIPPLLPFIHESRKVYIQGLGLHLFLFFIHHVTQNRERLFLLIIHEYKVS